MFEEFLKERQEAFLSMDERKIRAYMKKYGVQIPNEEKIFWASVHMARTGAKDLPIEERRKSKQWLDERGLRSMDDGDL